MIGLVREPITLPVLAGKLAALARRHRVPGAQLAIHRDGETLAVEAGELEYRTGRAITRDTAVPIGSISKSFTATVAMILVADGDLELSTPVGEYLPELGGLGARLTLGHLLSHTGGLATGPDSADVTTVSARRYLADHCRHNDLLLPPGAGFSYSNMGYVLVGQLIEKITGMNWAEATESILLRPLGIAPAFVGAATRRSSGRPIATGHSVNSAANRIRPVAQSLAPVEAPAGALAVSAVDLAALGRMHAGQGVPELLSPALAARMRRAVPAADPCGLADGWGLGLAVFRSNGAADWVGHDGNANGTSCYLRIDPDQGWVVAFTSNASTGYGLWQDLLDELIQAGIPVPGSGEWVAQARPTTPPPGCAGTYANGDVEYVVLAGEDGQLHLAVDGDAAARLTLYHGLSFSTPDPSSGRAVLGGRFLRDPVTGAIDKLQVGGRLARRRTHSVN